MLVQDSVSTEKPKILVVLHQEHSTPGRVGRILQSMGYELDIRRPRFGCPLPKTMDDHAAAVIFGGPMSANDEDDFVKQEIDWIATPLKANKPYLGICLGGQMMARQLGARVYRHPEKRVEIGYYPIKPTEHGEKICDATFPCHVYQWHSEGFDLPTGAVLLAEGQHFPVQAMRYGPSAYGIQFHPDVTYAMICRWSVRADHRLCEPGAQPAHVQRACWHQYDRAFDVWSHQFLDRWLSSAEPLTR